MTPAVSEEMVERLRNRAHNWRNNGDKARVSVPLGEIRAALSALSAALPLPVEGVDATLPYALSDSEIRTWIDACNYEPAKQSLRQLLEYRARERAIPAAGPSAVAVKASLTAEQVADRIGVTPYSDMRVHVVAAVNYARNSDALSTLAPSAAPESLNDAEERVMEQDYRWGVAKANALAIASPSAQPVAWQWRKKSWSEGSEWSEWQNGRGEHRVLKDNGWDWETRFLYALSQPQGELREALQKSHEVLSLALKSKKLPGALYSHANTALHMIDAALAGRTAG
jgi:hypothetical protein